MSSQATLTPIVTDAKPTEQLKEVEYIGNCAEQPCFELPEGMTIGRCKETGIMIELSLAKRQKLCDHEDTAYHKALTEKYSKQPKAEATQ